MLVFVVFYLRWGGLRRGEDFEVIFGNGYCFFDYWNDVIVIFFNGKII